MSVIGLDARTEQVNRLIYDNPDTVFGWHSVSCPCEECLNSDAVFCKYGKVTARSDMRGLSDDSRYVAEGRGSVKLAQLPSASHP